MTKSPRVHEPTRRMLDMLAAGVPLSLLIDLATSVRSDEVYRQEAPDDLSWTRNLRAG